MNWTQFKDPVSHMCLAGTVVEFWFQPFYSNDKYLASETFSKNQLYQFLRREITGVLHVIRSRRSTQVPLQKRLSTSNTPTKDVECPGHPEK